MTNDDRALVYELRKFQPDTTMCNEAADRIEALSAENERLKAALMDVADNSGILGAAIVREALGDTK